MDSGKPVTSEKPVLFLESIYTFGLNDIEKEEVMKLAVSLTTQKAAELGVVAVLARRYLGCYERDEYVLAPFYVYISKSKNGWQYLDLSLIHIYGYVREVCEYYTYLRCIKQDGILKVAFFFPEHLRLDGSKPAYEVYLDKEKRQFITYNSLIQKWSESKLDRLDWKRQYWYTKAYWISDEDEDVYKRQALTRSNFCAIRYPERPMRKCCSWNCLIRNCGSVCVTHRAA